MVPAVQVAKELGLDAKTDVPAKRAWPLDFAAVTDHSEYLGAVAQIDIPGSAFSKSALGQKLSSGGLRAFYAAAAAIVEGGANNESTPDLKAAALAADGWNVEMRAANAYYAPGVFTTFLAYEWTATPGNGIHMHRNVIFNSAAVPPPSRQSIPTSQKISGHFLLASASAASTCWRSRTTAISATAATLTGPCRTAKPSTLRTRSNVR